MRLQGGVFAFVVVAGTHICMHGKSARKVRSGGGGGGYASGKKRMGGWGYVRLNFRFPGGLTFFAEKITKLELRGECRERAKQGGFQTPPKGVAYKGILSLSSIEPFSPDLDCRRPSLLSLSSPALSLGGKTSEQNGGGEFGGGKRETS